MKYLICCLLALLVCVAPGHLWAAAKQFEREQIAEKLWRVIDIEREYTPPFQTHVILEAPDRQRLLLTFRDATARTLINDDVIKLAPKGDTPAVIPEEALDDSFSPQPVTWGQMRWWKERLKQEGKEIKKDWRLFLEEEKKGTEI